MQWNTLPKEVRKRIKEQRMCARNRKQIVKAKLNSNISVIVSNVIRLSILPKRQRLSDWNKNKTREPISCYL